MRKLKLVAPLLLISLLLLSGFTCSHKAAAGSRGVAASLVALQDSEITLHQAGKIDDAEHQKLQQGFLALAQTGQNVNRCIGNGGAGGCVDQAITQLDILVSADVVGIKNPDSKQAITLAAQSLKAALVLLKGAL